jgi:hypothetical protein
LAHLHFRRVSERRRQEARTLIRAS